MELYELIVQRQYGEALALARLENNPEQTAPFLESEECLNALCELCDLLNPVPEAVAVVAAIVRLNPNLVATPNSTRADAATPLHVCVQKKQTWDSNKGSYIPLPRSVDMALTLIRANPDAITAYHGNSNAKTPLHLACEANADVAVIQAMVRARPEAVLQKMRLVNLEFNMTPFHRACIANADLPLLKVLLELHPTLATARSEHGKYPIDFLWIQYKQVSMEKIALILATGHHGRVVDPLPMHNLLHLACCSQLCPWEMVDDIFERFPHQASQRDDAGNLAIHYAVRNHHLLFRVTPVPERPPEGHMESRYNLQAGRGISQCFV